MLCPTKVFPSKCFFFFLRFRVTALAVLDIFVQCGYFSAVNVLFVQMVCFFMLIKVQGSCNQTTDQSEPKLTRVHHQKYREWICASEHDHKAMWDLVWWTAGVLLTMSFMETIYLPAAQQDTASCSVYYH